MTDSPRGVRFGAAFLGAMQGPTGWPGDAFGDWQGPNGVGGCCLLLLAVFIGWVGLGIMLVGMRRGGKRDGGGKR